MTKTLHPFLRHPQSCLDVTDHERLANITLRWIDYHEQARQETAVSPVNWTLLKYEIAILIVTWTTAAFWDKSLRDISVTCSDVTQTNLE